MSDKTLEESVRDIVAESLDIDKEKITLQSSFAEDLGADSLDTVELVMAFEEKFGCEIPDEQAENIKTVGDAVNYIRHYQEKNS